MYIPAHFPHFMSGQSQPRVPLGDLCYLLFENEEVILQTCLRPRDRLVQIQDGAAGACPGGQFGGRKIFCERMFANGQ